MSELREELVKIIMSTRDQTGAILNISTKMANLVAEKLIAGGYRPAPELTLIGDEEINEVDKKEVAKIGFHNLSPIEQYRAEGRAIAQAQLDADKKALEGE